MKPIRVVLSGCLQHAVCLLLFYVFTCKEARSQSSYFINYSLADGLPSNTVYYAMEDSNGFLWIGTSAGVCRYDGLRFTTFTPQDGLADNEVFQIMEDSRGRIWFASFNGRMSYYFNGRFYNETVDSTLQQLKTKGLFSGIFEDSRKRIWFSAVSDGIYMLDGSDVHHFDNGFRNSRFVWEDSSFVWALVDDALVRFDSDQPLQYTRVSLQGFFSSSNASRKLLADTLSNILYCPDAYNGLYEVHYTSGKAEKKKEISGMGVCRLKDDGLYVYHNQGLVPWDQHRNMLGNPLFENSSISHVIQDRHKGVWITTLDQGIFYSPSLAIEQFAIPGTNHITDIAGDGREVCFFSTEGTYGRWQTNTKKITLEQIPGWNGQRIENLMYYQGEIWAAMNPGGVLRINEHTIKLYDTDHTIKSFSFYGGDSICLSTGPGGLRRYSLTNLLPPRALDYVKASPPERTFASYIDRSGRTWFATQNGLKMYDKGKYEDLSQRHPYLQNRITYIAEDRSGTIWVMVESTAIVMIDTDFQVRHVIDQRNGLRDLQCKKFVIDTEDDLWFITHNTLGQIRVLENEVVVRSVLRVGTKLLNDLYVSNGKIHLATNHGMIVVPDTFEINNNTAIEITGFWAGEDRWIDLTEPNPKIATGNEDVRVTYASASFTGRTDQYRFQLQASDTAWSYTTATELKFLALEPGRYFFRVQVKQNDGSWSAPAGFAFAIDELLWRRWWFLTLAVVVIFTAIFFLVMRFYNHRLRRLELQERILESELRALTAQMNPHFIANTLNTIQRFFISNETRTANKLLSRFGTLMRTTLENTTRSFITIEQEVLFLSNYLEIEQSRFSHKFTYEIKVDDSLEPAVEIIPSMIIQPFVENAIIHGFALSDSAYKVTVSFSRRANGLRVTIDDNGVGRSFTSKPHHVSRGTALIRDRLSVLSVKRGINYGLEIFDKSAPEKGTRVELYL